MEMTIKVEGLEKVQSSLKEFGTKLARQTLRKGVFKGAELIRDRLKISAPIRREGTLGKPYGSNKFALQYRYPGYLKDHIGARYQKDLSGPTDVHYGTGPLGWAFYGNFVEDGHKLVSGRTGKQYGFVSPHPWIEPVFRNAHVDATEKMKNTLLDEINKVWKDLGFTGWD